MKKRLRSNFTVTAGILGLALSTVLASCNRELPLLEPLAWNACLSVISKDDPRGITGKAGECAKVSVPLRWAKKDGTKIEIAVKRFPSKEPFGNLFLQDGGPGGTGLTFETNDFIAKANEIGWNIYVYSLRGAPQSKTLGTSLECSIVGFEGDPISEQTCRKELANKWGDDLIGFNTTEAADDLNAVVSTVRAANPKQRIGLYAASYGTLLAQTVLQRHPKAFDAMVLDGVVPILNDGRFPNGDETWERAFKPDALEAQYTNLYRECANIPACKARLGADPVAAAKTAYNKLFTGTCNIGGPENVNAIASNGPGLVGAYNGVHYVIAYRANRCNVGDQAALKAMAEVLLEPSGPGVPEIANQVAYVHYYANDLLPMNFSYAKTEAAINANTFARIKDFVKIRTDFKEWQKLPESASHRTYLPTAAQIPVLVMHGSLDQATATVLFDETVRYLKPQATLVFPTGFHVSANSPDSAECAQSAIAGFLENPTEALDRSCIKTVAQAVDFKETGPGTQAAPSFAGTYLNGSLWGD